MDHSPYLNDAMTKTESLIEKALRTLNPHEDEFDAFVCIGVSGLLVAPTLAYLMGKRLAVVRKLDDKQNHAVVRVESALNRKDRWVFVDDLIASGETLRYVLRAMGNTEGFEGEMVGRFMYNTDHYTGDKWHV